MNAPATNPNCLGSTLRDDNRRTAPRSQRPCRRRCRRGATLVEAAITTILFFYLVIGMIDVSLLVQRHNGLTHAARTLCRECIVHGALATELGVWGPGEYSSLASASTPITEALRPHLAGMNPEEVTVVVQWPDGGNDVRDDHRVRVILGTTYRPVFAAIFGVNREVALEAESIMPIAH